MLRWVGCRVGWGVCSVAGSGHAGAWVGMVCVACSGQGGCRLVAEAAVTTCDIKAGSPASAGCLQPEMVMMIMMPCKDVSCSAAGCCSSH